MELAALLLARRPLALGAVSGLLIGTVGFATEYAWTQVAFRLPWTPDIVIEGPLMAAAAVDRPSWLTITSWQGGGLRVEHLVPVGDGRYRTTQPVPLSGNWKTLVRLQDGRTLTAVPLYLPADAAIGKPELPAPAQVTRDAVNEKSIMQRELKEGVPSWLWNTASAVVLVCAVLLVLTLGWGVSRVSPASQPPSHRATAPLQQVV